MANGAESSLTVAAPSCEGRQDRPLRRIGEGGEGEAECISYGHVVSNHSVI